MIPLPPKLKLILGLLLVGGLGALQALSRVEPSWTWAGTVIQLLAALELYLTPPTPPPAAARASQRGLVSLATVATVALAGVATALALAYLTGCALDAPIVPVTPSNAAQVQSCQSTATLHNGVVLGDYTIGIGGATVGVVGAALPGSNASGKTDLAIVGAALAALAAGGAGLAAIETRAYVADNCGALISPLLSRHAVAGPLPSPLASATQQAPREDGGAP